LKPTSDSDILNNLLQSLKSQQSSETSFDNESELGENPAYGAIQSVPYEPTASPIIGQAIAKRMKFLASKRLEENLLAKRMKFLARKRDEDYIDWDKRMKFLV